MTRADLEAAVPKCPKGMTANIPGAVCGVPLRWEPWTLDDDGAELGRWVCGVHGVAFSGTQAAKRAGFVAMWFAEAA